MKCENPQRIWNKYLNKFILAPCGHCRACQINRSFALSARVKNEMLSHKFNIFFTLTYDNEHCPCMFASDDNVYRGISRNTVIEKLDTFFDVLPYPIPSFPYAMSLFYYPDVQFFIKRLRSYVNYQLYGTKKMQFSLRYFVCGEYGTDKHRSHYHGIIHCDNVRVAEAVIKAIPACWSFCDWRALLRDWYRKGCPRKRYPLPQYCQTFASSYVANYVASNSCDNPLYSLVRFRPFVKYSKRPMYGLSSFDRQILERIRDKSDCGRLFEKVCKDGQSFTFDVCSVSLQRSFFPRSSYFDKIPDRLKLALYWKTFAYIRDEGDFLDELKEIPIKDFGDSLTNHCIRIFKAAKRLCKYFGVEFSEPAWQLYLFIRDRFFVAYESCKLFFSLSRYDGDMSEYVLSSYNNFIGNENVKILMLSYRNIIPDLYIILNHWVGYNSPRDKLDTINYIDRYKAILLPKHFNSFFTGF